MCNLDKKIGKKERGSSPPLGSIVNNSANVDNQAVTEGVLSEKAKERYLLDLWALKRTAGRVLMKSDMYRKTYEDKKNNVIGEFTRVRRCSEFTLNATVPLARGAKGEFFHGNLEHCASIWVCPLCRWRILKERCDRLEKNLLGYDERGYKVNFVTLTLSHLVSDDLESNIRALKRGINAMFSPKTVRDFRKLYDVEYFTSLEITYGGNGFHPHIHMIILTKMPKEVHSVFFAALQHSYETFIWGVKNKVVKGVTFKLLEWDGTVEMLTEYMLKDEQTRAKEATPEERKHWKLSKEIIDVNSSKKNSVSWSIFDLLRLCNGEVRGLFNENALNFDPEYVFCRYAEAIKGKRMNNCSRGFWAYADDIDDIDAVSDDEIDEIYYSIERDVWVDVVERNYHLTLRKMLDEMDAVEFLNRKGLSVYFDYQNRTILRDILPSVLINDLQPLFQNPNFEFESDDFLLLEEQRVLAPPPLPEQLDLFG